MKTPLNLSKFVLSIFVLSIIALSSCTKHTTKQVYEYEKEATTEVTKDSLYTHTPKPNTIEAEKNIDIAPCPPCPQSQSQPKSQPQSQPQSQPKPQSISTDTLWVHGTYANSYAFIRKNKLVHGMVEGKQFDILLKNITTERNTYKELYRNEVEKVVVEKKTWKKDLVIVLLLLLLIFVIAQKSIRR